MGETWFISEKRGDKISRQKKDILEPFISCQLDLVCAQWKCHFVGIIGIQVISRMR
jgi:hypothetical protein